jgi:hypothetical protein
MEILLNKCYGGFGLSDKAKYEIAKRKGLTLYMYVALGDDFGGDYEFVSDEDFLSGKYSSGSSAFKNIVWCTKDLGYKVIDEDVRNNIYKGWDDEETHRTDKDWVEAVKKLGASASALLADLAVISIPDGYYYTINDYDGVETCYYSASPIAII